MDCLAMYFADNSSVQPDDVANFILEKRSTVVKETIRHKPPKGVVPKDADNGSK
jgi:hypothetical protein